MPILREILPSLTGRLPGLAGLPVDLADTDSLTMVASAIEHCMDPDLDGGLGRLEEVATDLLRDLSAFPQAPGVRAGIDLLRLVTSYIPLMMACDAGRDDIAWHWAVAPLIDGLPEELEIKVDVARPFHALADHTSVARPRFWAWAGAVCHLAWSGGYVMDVATKVAVRLPEELMGLGPDDGPLLVVACSVATMLDRMDHPAVPAVAEHLDRLAEDEGLDPETRVALALQLTSHFGRHLRGSARDRADQALTDLDGHLTPPQRLQLLVNAVTGDVDETRRRANDLLAAARATDTHIRDVSSDAPLNAAHLRGRLFTILAPVVRTLAEAGDAHLAASVLRAWQGVDETGLEAPPPLLAFRLDTHQLLWCAPTGTATTTLPADLTEILNATLGLSDVDAGNGPPLEGLPEERAVGLPVYDRAAALEAVTRASVDPDFIGPLLEGVDPRNGVVHIGHDRLPICSLLQGVTGRPVPLVVSHEVPLPDRPVRRVQMWHGDLLLGQTEVQAVTEVMARAGIDIDVIDGTQKTVDDFVDAYTDPNIDVMWISSHTHFGHWRPDDTAVALSEELTIPLSDFARMQPPVNGRRLLVLNTCDSASVTALGGPSTVGVAGIAAGGRQAVAGHLWPVRYRPAAVFGAMLAIGLVTCERFDDAFLFATGPRPTAELVAILEEAGLNTVAEYAAHEESRTFLDVASPVMMI